LIPKTFFKIAEHLYSVGASTHPGAGLPTALISARLLAIRILDDLHP
jgi:phytoene dehydrogenase-like protein